MKKTIKLRIDYTQGFGLYFGYQNNTIILLVPFMALEIEFVKKDKDEL